MAHGGFFREQAALAADFRLVTIDLRGHGASQGAPAPTVERIAADVAELVEALDLKGAIGIGWSLGATVLWRVLAGPAGPRFAGSVVIDMTARVRNDERWDLGLSPEACTARSLAIRDDYETFALSAGQAIFAQPVAESSTELAGWVSHEFARNDAGSMSAVWESLVEEDLRELLGSIRHPTLIVHGAHSSLYGQGTANHLVGVLPDASAVRFERSGHAPHLEEPLLFNQTIKDFAGRLSRARSAQTIE